MGDSKRSKILLRVAEETFDVLLGLAEESLQKYLDDPSYKISADEVKKSLFGSLYNWGANKIGKLNPFGKKKPKYEDDESFRKHLREIEKDLPVDQRVTLHYIRDKEDFVKSLDEDLDNYAKEELHIENIMMSGKVPAESKSFNRLISQLNNLINHRKMVEELKNQTLKQIDDAHNKLEELIKKRP